MGLSAFLDVARGGFFLTAGTPLLNLLWTRSRVERHNAFKAPRGFHDTEGLFLFRVRLQKMALFDTFQKACKLACG